MAENRIWILVTVTIKRPLEELAGSLLSELGATGTIIFEENLEHLKLGAYFEEGADAGEIVRSIQAEAARTGLAEQLLGISLSTVPDQDWMQKWKDGFEPIEIGERLIVAPSWKLPIDLRGRTLLRMDPGMAFGTGTHETTRLCLELIERYWKGGRLLDVGTGTGILAIAASLLQPESRILALDVDPVAVEVARENAAINNVRGSVEVSGRPLSKFAGQDFDLVAANLTAEVIVALMADLAGCLRQRGLMILSGILNELRNEVCTSAEEHGLAIIEQCEAGEWSAVVAERA